MTQRLTQLVSGIAGRKMNTTSLLPSSPAHLPILHSKELSIYLMIRQNLVIKLELYTYKFRYRNIFLVSLGKYLLSAHLVQACY